MTTILRDAPRKSPVDESRREHPQGRSSDSLFHCDYWLRHCEGYHVEEIGGRLGYVEEIREGELGSPPVLGVRAGRLGNRFLTVPVSEVAFIVPRAERIWLKASAQLTDSVPSEGGVR